MEATGELEQRAAVAASRDRIVTAGKSWQKVLGLNTSASVDEVKRAYRQLALMHHPDKAHGDADTFRAVQEAYVLGLRKCRKQAPSQAVSTAKSDVVGKSSATSVAKAGAKAQDQSQRPVQTASKVEASGPGGEKGNAGEGEDRDRGPKRARPKSWALPADASKVKMRKVVEQWGSCMRVGQKTMPDDISMISPEELAAWIRAASCITVDVRDEHAHTGLEPKNASRLSFAQLFTAPEEALPNVERLRADGRTLVLFSDKGGVMGTCGLVGALLSDVFGFEEGRICRLEGGVEAWGLCMETKGDIARTVEPLAMRMQRRRATAAAGRDSGTAKTGSQDGFSIPDEGTLGG